MTNRLFKFDPNKCTGCNACQIACILENDLNYNSSWRQVVTYNEHRYPDQQVFHLSMACNHCGDPPCLKYCPAKAYHHEEKFGTVQIDPDKCIGCKYCSWVCPYDAPKLNSAEKVMEKCTFCVDRLDQNLEPACITICPTEALKSQESDLPLSNSSLAGLTKTKLSPSLEIMPFRKDHSPAETHVQPFADDIVQFFRSMQKYPQDKINPKSEWTLLLFSLLVSSLIGYTFASILKGVPLSPFSVLLTGFTGILISSFHLSKKTRAYRAILNWRYSWLSREIILFTLFLIFSTVYSISNLHLAELEVIIISTGFLTLFSMDMVYYVIPQNKKIIIHSSSIILTGLLFLSFFLNYDFFAIVLILKFILYFSKKLKSGRLFTGFSLLRIFSGFILAPVIWYIPHDLALWISFLCLAIGELTDRAQFYQELDIITPYKQMNLDLIQSLSQFRNNKFQSEH